jgi:hypothetical protein
MIKRQFGNILSRMLWGGTVLTPAEHQLLSCLVAELPWNIRTIVLFQLESYNLVQREVDGRALNFYRKKRFAFWDRTELPVLEHKHDEAPLVRLETEILGQSEPLHAVLTAVRGRVFCLTFSRAVPKETEPACLRVKHVTQAWRSNFSIEKPGSEA